MSSYQKYLKYKEKYISLKNKQFGGNRTWTPSFLKDDYWLSIASSADGRFLIAGRKKNIYTSNDYGVSWHEPENKLNDINWVSVALSADGSKFFAVPHYGKFTTSDDRGQTWKQSGEDRFWKSIASSANGKNIVATTIEVHLGIEAQLPTGFIYTSSDSGATWKGREIKKIWTSVASSADGRVLVAAAMENQIYISTDFGNNWIGRESYRKWKSVALSADGKKIVAVARKDRIYTSTDYGENWTPRAMINKWDSVTSSADGNKLVATIDDDGEDYIYISVNSGESWTPSGSNGKWCAVASSADGSRLVALKQGHEIHTSIDLPIVAPAPAPVAPAANP